MTVNPVNIGMSRLIKLVLTNLVLSRGWDILVSQYVIPKYQPAKPVSISIANDPYGGRFPDAGLTFARRGMLH